jgi:hypothetical protein
MERLLAAVDSVFRNEVAAFDRALREVVIPPLAERRG